MTERIVIHLERLFEGSSPRGNRTYSGRFRWFTYNGETFLIAGGNANGGNYGWGYEVLADGTWEQVRDGYFTLDEIRREFPSDYAAWRSI